MDMMIDWTSDYWWLALIALVIGLGTAYWMWCVECPDDVRDDLRDPSIDEKTQPAKPLEPKKPEIAAARPMNFKDAPGFDTGKATGAAAAMGAAGLAGAAVAKVTDAVEEAEEVKAESAPEPITEAAPKPAAKVEKTAPIAKADAPLAVQAEPVKNAAIKAAPKITEKAADAQPKATAKKSTAKTTTKAATTKMAAPKAATVKTSAKSAPIAQKEEPVKTGATKAAPVKKTAEKKGAPVKKTGAGATAKAASSKAEVKTKTETPKAKTPKAEAKPVAKTAAAKPKAESVKKDAAATMGAAALGAVMNEAGKPKIRGAGTGAPDDLNLIKGVGPKLNTLLIGLGVTRFAQIASWTATEVAEVDQYLGNFTGRIARDNWVDQADYLAKGDVAGFSKKYGELGSEIKK